MITLNPDGFGLATRNGGTCSICGAGNTDPETKLGRPCISTGILIDFEGYWDICVNCAAIIGTLVGLIPSADYDHLIEDYNRVVALLADQAVELVRKEDGIRVLSSELVGAAKRGVYANGVPSALVEIDEEPDFSGS